MLSLGIVAMKKRLREKVWWVRIDAMVENFVKDCDGCVLVSTPATEPMVRTPLPAGPWQKLALDFTEVTNGTHLMVVVDYFSRFPEIEIMTTITAKATIFKLRTIFARFGFPREIICDNGPPFGSDEFVTFCKSSGITLNHSVPYAPFQNGLVERYNRTLLKSIKISVAQGRDWKNDVYDFLLAYRNTPHSITNETPAKLMFGRNLKDKLPDYSDADVQGSWAKLQKTDHIKKEKGRIYGDNKRRAKHSAIDIGDHVVVKNFLKRNKLTPTFDPQPYIVTNKNGTRLTLKNLETGVEYDRHINHTKRLTCNSPFFNLDQPALVFDEIVKANEIIDHPKAEDDTPAASGPVRTKKHREARKPEYLRDYLVYKCKRIA